MTTKGRPTHDVSLDALEGLLREELDDHRSLLETLDRQREAIRVADASALGECAEKEQQILQLLRARERHRSRLVEQLRNELGGEAPATISSLADHAEEPLRTRLLSVAAELREAVARARRESSIVRAAAEALTRHLGGLLQSMQAAVGSAGVYGRRGRIDTASPLACSVDLRS
ncbi:MAG: flagellar protein FlgN [Planctomycetota bacterium]|jgi:hypothetical protein